MSVEIHWSPAYDAEALLREIGLEVVGADPGPLHHRCPACGSITHGQPYFDTEIWVSLARAEGLTVVALSTVGPVGVDVAVGTSEEVDRWVRVEAVAKARGTGLVVEHAPDAVDLWISMLVLPSPYRGAVAGIRPYLSAVPEVRAAPRRTTRS